MKSFRGGERVEPGLYFNPRHLSFTSVDEEAPLPGAAVEVHRRVPTLLLLVVGPLLGLVYVVFLPFIGFAMLAWLLGVKAAHLAGGAARTVVRVRRPGWEPAMAFFSRSRRAEPKREAPDAWAEETRKKLEPTEKDTA